MKHSPRPELDKFTQISIKSGCNHFNQSQNFIVSICLHQCMEISLNYFSTFSFKMTFTYWVSHISYKMKKNLSSVSCIKKLYMTCTQKNIVFYIGYTSEKLILPILLRLRTLMYFHALVTNMTIITYLLWCADYEFDSENWRLVDFHSEIMKKKP